MQVLPESDDIAIHMTLDIDKIALDSLCHGTLVTQILYCLTITQLCRSILQYNPIAGSHDKIHHVIILDIGLGPILPQYQQCDEVNIHEFLTLR